MNHRRVVAAPRPAVSPHLAIAARAALTALAAAAMNSGASAQSGVTMFGTLDLNVTVTKAGGQTMRAMDQGGNLLPSRLGVRGSEDLGGGLSAGFWLESPLLPDTGGVQGAAFWGRRSTLSVASSSLGEIRLGRDYAPTFWNLSQFSPVGTVGPSGSANIIDGWPFGVGGARTLVRTNNSIGYFLPRNLGGFYGQLQVALPEGSDGSKYTGGRLGYAAGPIDVAVAYGQTPAGGQTTKFGTLGGTYNFGMVRLYANYFEQKAPGDKQVNVMLGVAVPVGLSTFKATVARSDRSGPGLDADDASQFGLTYTYHLSKRTALYAAYGRISNEGMAAFVPTDSSPPATPGGRASAMQLGVSHNF
jgi:predicted porin